MNMQQLSGAAHWSLLVQSLKQAPLIQVPAQQVDPQGTVVSAGQLGPHPTERNDRATTQPIAIDASLFTEVPFRHHSRD
jgi:hypothetical protein